MKRTILYFLFSVLPFLVSAQFNTSIDLIASIDYSSLSNSFSSNQDGSRSIRFGANFNFRVFEQISMKTGIRFAQLGSESKMEDLRWPSEFDPIGGWIPDPTLPRYLHFSSSLRFIEIPLIARYEFGHKKLSYYLEFGISPHLYLNTKRTEESNLSPATSEIKRDENGIKRVLMGYIFGFGVNYNISKKLQLFVQPTIRLYSTNPDLFSSETGFRSIGLEFGVRHALIYTKL